ITLTADDENVLLSIFSSDLGTIAHQILDYYERNSIPSTVPVYYDLDSNQLAQLNLQGSIVLNLKEAGAIFPGHANARLLGIQAYALEAAPAKGQALGRIASVLVSFEHQGVSRFEFAGRQYEFQNYTEDTVSRVRWGTALDVLRGFKNDTQPSWLASSI